MKPVCITEERPKPKLITEAKGAAPFGDGSIVVIVTDDEGKNVFMRKYPNGELRYLEHAF